MKLDPLSLKTIIKKMDFLRKSVVIQWNTWKEKGTKGKIFLLLANKLVKTFPDTLNAKELYQ